MKDFLKEIIRLWWVEGGVALKNPKSEASIKALRTILREDLDFPNEAIEYIIENIKTPTTHFASETKSSGINVGKNQSAVSAKLHPDWDDEELTEEDDSEIDDSEEEADDKDDAVKDIKLNGLTAYEKDKLKKEDTDEPENDKELVDKDIKRNSLTAAEKDKLKNEEIDDKLLKTKLTNPTTGNKNQVSTLLGKKQSDNPAYQVAKSFLGDKGIDDEDVAAQSGSKSAESDDNTSQSDVDRRNFDKKDKSHKDNPNGPTRNEILEDLNNGNIKVLSEYQSGLSDNREKGIAGAGGPVASEGESKYCAAVDTEFTKWDGDNKEVISSKESELKDRKRTSDEKRIARQLGLQSDSEEFNTHLAKREVWANRQLDKLKSDKDSVFYKKFKGDDKKYKDWMYVAYDGAKTTQRAIEDSPIDSSKPKKTIQSTAEVDQAVQAHLEDNVTNAKTPGDKKHAKKQIKNFNKYKGYHDTYVIGKDENGRTTYLGITNKKDDQLRDPQNNTTPKQRFEQLERKYGKEVAVEVTKSLDKNIERVSEVQQNTVKSASVMGVTDEFVSLCETEEMKPYIDDLKNRKDLNKYLKDKGLDINKLSTSELLTEMNNKSKDMISAGKEPPYNPYGKIAIKVGELSQIDKFRKNNPNINFDDDSIKASIDIKETEKSVVKDSHKSVVMDLQKADTPDGYSEDTPDADNGKHQQGYIGGILDAAHIDSYIDEEDDDGILLQAGINGVKPSMIRECVSERSGFKGDSSTLEGKKSLKAHLRKRCRVTPGESSVKIMDNGKEVDLFEDTWRTAGSTQKVATHFGEAMRDCLQKKTVKT